MENNIKNNIYMYNWITLLYNRNWNIINQLYFNNIFLKRSMLNNLSPDLLMEYWLLT